MSHVYRCLRKHREKQVSLISWHPISLSFKFHEDLSQFGRDINVFQIPKGLAMIKRIISLSLKFHKDPSQIGKDIGILGIELRHTYTHRHQWFLSYRPSVTAKHTVLINGPRTICFSIGSTWYSTDGPLISKHVVERVIWNLPISAELCSSIFRWLYRMYKVVEIELSARFCQCGSNSYFFLESGRKSGRFHPFDINLSSFSF